MPQLVQPILRFERGHFDVPFATGDTPRPSVKQHVQCCIHVRKSDKKDQPYDRKYVGQTMVDDLRVGAELERVGVVVDPGDVDAVVVPAASWVGLGA